MTLSQRHDDGFTLIELLVSLALLSLMTAYALNAFSSLRDINRIEGRIGAQMEVEAVARHLREVIADVRPAFAKDENNTPLFLFKGSPNSLEFVTASTGERETGGLYLVRYSVDTDGALVAERQILRDRATDKATKVVLLRGVKDVTFKYWASGPTDFVSGASDTWKQKDSLPTRIEVAVSFDDSDSRSWPPTLVNLRTAR